MGQVLMSVKTASEGMGLWPMINGLIDRYDRAGIQPHISCTWTETAVETTNYADGSTPGHIWSSGWTSGTSCGGSPWAAQRTSTSSTVRP